MFYKILSLIFTLFILYTATSCNKVKNYFRDPDTEILSETLLSAKLTGYVCNSAVSILNGGSLPYLTMVSRSNEGFPCTTLMVMDLEDAGSDKAGSVTIAGLWPEAGTAILSLLYTNYHAGSNTLDLLGIETIPVIRDGDNIHIALASQEIKLNPDQESFLNINLNTLEIESELLRLNMPRPSDVYVAVLQNAYFIDIDTEGTPAELDDDDYTVTGGGQLIEVNGNSAEIVQQAMVEVHLSSNCGLNPLSGMALLKVTGLENEGFPELGTAVLEFTDNCNGYAWVFAATGMYVGSNGQKVRFLLE
jgi:hypothetical protein